MPQPWCLRSGVQPGAMGEFQASSDIPLSTPLSMAQIGAGSRNKAAPQALVHNGGPRARRTLTSSQRRMENLMRSKITALAMAAALAGAAVLATSTGAAAQRWDGYGYRGWAPAAGIGLAAGAVIGGAVAVATAPLYGPAYYGNWAYGPANYGAADPYYGGVAPSPPHCPPPPPLFPAPAT